MIRLKRYNVEIIVDSEEQAKIKESAGFKRLSVGESTKAAKAPEKGEERPGKALEDMTRQELLAYAYENGIDVDKRARKAEILAALQ